MLKKVIIYLMICILLPSTVSAKYIEPSKEYTILSAMGIEDGTAVYGGYIMNIDKRQAMDLTSKQLDSFVNEASRTKAYRRVVKNPFCGYAIVLRTAQGDKTYFASSGVQVGKYGDDNYFCYMPNTELNSLGDIYGDFLSSSRRYSHSLFDINMEYDYLIYPEEEWAVEDVLYAAVNSLLPYEICSSYGKAMSREEFCILVANYLKVSFNYNMLEDYFPEHNMTYSVDCFTDTSGCDSSIYMLYAMGVVNGKSSKEFHPDDALTREEAAVILKKAAYVTNIELPSVNMYFSDRSSISSWATDAVNAMGYNKIMNGIEGGFKPKSFLTCEQAIAAINRLYRLR